MCRFARMKVLVMQQQRAFGQRFVGARVDFLRRAWRLGIGRVFLFIYHVNAQGVAVAHGRRHPNEACVAEIAAAEAVRVRFILGVAVALFPSVAHDVHPRQQDIGFGEARRQVPDPESHDLCVRQ